MEEEEKLKQIVIKGMGIFFFISTEIHFETCQSSAAEKKHYISLRYYTVKIKTMETTGLQQKSCVHIWSTTGPHQPVGETKPQVRNF